MSAHGQWRAIPTNRVPDLMLDGVADMSLDEFSAVMHRNIHGVDSTRSSLLGVADHRSHNVGTLDDVPDFALSGLEALYSLMFKRFEAFHGHVQHGPRTVGVFDDGYWGRQMMLSSHEVFQMRFSPKGLVSNVDHNVVMMATRVTSLTGHSHVTCAVLFRPETMSESHVVSESMCRPVACKGLHILMAGFFKRHNPGIVGTNRLTVPTNGVAYDPFGYQAVRATTYSVHKSDKKGLESSSDHTNANSATSGSSILTIAGELVDTHLTPVVARAAIPIAYKKWKQDCTDFRAEIMSAARSPEEGNAAILSAATIAEMMSAEGFVAMAANRFFTGARPDRFFMPHGMPLTIVMAVRLAMHWEKYGLSRPSRADVAANDQLRMLFEGTSYGPLPLLASGAFWAIDVVIRDALRMAEQELEVFKKEQKVPAGCCIPVIDDQKIFYQRVGQRLITSTFGLGSSVGVKPNTSRGVPWRFHDAIDLKRMQYLADPDRGACNAEGLQQATISLAPIGRRRTELVKMMLEVEEWLRTGVYADQRVTPRNTDTPMDERILRIKSIVDTLSIPGLVTSLANSHAQVSSTGKPIEDALACGLLEHLNLGGVALGINEIKDCLMHGPVHHFHYYSGAYIVSPSQSNACCDCETPVHVLQGIMLSSRYSECTGCHARRCLHCTDVYAKAVRVTSPQSVGKRCHACGADPAFVDVVRSNGSNGQETFSVHLGPRVPWRRGASLEPVEKGNHTQAAPSASQSANPPAKADVNTALGRGRKASRK